MRDCQFPMTIGEFGIDGEGKLKDSGRDLLAFSVGRWL